MPVDRRVQRAATKLDRRALKNQRKVARKPPLSVERIVETALDLVRTEGFDALTMRQVAAAMNTGAASLYAHVVNKADLDALIIGYLCSKIVLPQPDPEKWREQMVDLLVQIRDLYLVYPGVSQAALAVVPSNLETLRISEGMLAVLLAGGVEPQRAAWGLDSLTLYVNAYCFELSLWVERQDYLGVGWDTTQAGLLRRFDALSDDEFPLTKRYAPQLTAGSGHDRFDFTVGLMLDGLGGH